MKNTIMNTKGFTILELIVSMVVGTIILGALISTFVLQRDRYEVQEQYKDMSYTARAAMDMIARDVTSAGYNPGGALQNKTYPQSAAATPVPFVGVPYNVNMLEIISDLNGNGDTADPNEWIRYRYNAGTKQIQRALTPVNPTIFSGSVEDHGWVPLAENVDNFSFSFLRSDGTTSVNAISDQDLIRAVRLTITAQSEKPDKNSGYKSTTLTADVKIRNMGLAKPSPATVITEGETGGTPSGTEETPEETPVVPPALPEGFVEKEVTLTEDGDPDTGGDIAGEVPADQLPTDCKVKVAVGTCITANNKGDVLLRVRVLDHVTFEPVDGAVVTWSVRDLNSNPVKTYNYGALFPFGDHLDTYPEGQGWYGGQSICSCSDAAVDLLCASTNPLNLDSNVVPAWFKERYFEVVVDIDLYGCGSGQVVVTSSEIYEAAAL